MSSDQSEVVAEAVADHEREPEAREVCFVIAPIGSDGSAIRERTNNLFQHAIQPVVDDFGLEPVVAHRISEPGNIPKQVVTLLFESKLVIADLTDHNGNVMYELAIRHATGKPVVKIAQEGHTPPFDIGAQRTKFYRAGFGGADEFRGELRSAVEKALSPSHDPVNPIQAFRQDFTLKRVLEGEIDALSAEEGGELSGVLRQIVDKIEDLEAKVERPSTRQSEDPDSEADGAGVPGGGLTGSTSEPTGPSATRNPLMHILGGKFPSGMKTETKIDLKEPESPFDSLERTAELVRRLQSDSRITDASFSEDEQGNLRLKVFHDSGVSDDEFDDLLQSKAEEIADTTGE